MKIKTLILLGPFVFLIHDLEEVFTVESWIRNHQQLLQKFSMMKKVVSVSGYTTLEFGITVTFLFLCFNLISYYARKNPNGVGMNCFLAAILILLVNVFTHLAQTILFKMYTPGVITAVSVVLPYTILVFRSLSRNQLLNEIHYLQVIGISLLFIPLIFAPLLILNVIL